MKDNGKELLPKVDETGNIIGMVTRLEAHSGSMTLHPVVHLHVFNDKGDIFLQKRPLWKDIQPGVWDTATGGHIDYGENVIEALYREVNEELGIKHFKPHFLTSYIYRSDKEREFIYVYTATVNDGITPNKNELDDGRFWSRAEVIANIGKGVFTPNFESEYQRLFF